VETGGLISYRPNQRSIEQRPAEYVDKICKRAKRADLPVEGIYLCSCGRPRSARPDLFDIDMGRVISPSFRSADLMG
jgi:hypothetical protein